MEAHLEFHDAIKKHAPPRVERKMEGFRRPMEFFIQNAIDEQLSSPPLKPNKRRPRPENILLKMCDQLKTDPTAKRKRKRRHRKILLLNN